MASMNEMLGGDVHFKYFTLPPGFVGRGGVVELFMAYHGIRCEEERVAFPWASPEIKKKLVESGESLTGTLPVVTLGGQHLCGHLPILRFFENKMGISSSDAMQEYRLDEVADEYTSWRNTWANTLGGDETSIKSYKSARTGFYDLLEAFYVRQATTGPFFLRGENPRYADFAILAIMSDDQTVYGPWDYSSHPSLGTLWTSLKKSPPLSKFFPQ